MNKSKTLFTLLTIMLLSCALASADNAFAALSSVSLSDATDSGSSNSDDITNVNTPDLEFMADSGYTVDVTTDTQISLGSVTADGTLQTITLPTLSDGDHTLSVIMYGGNPLTFVSEPFSVTIDTTDPSVPSITSLEPNTTLNRYDMAITADLGNTIVVTSEGDGSVTSGTVVNVPQIFDVYLIDGTHDFTITATDTAGNTATSSIDSRTVSYSASSTLDTTAPLTPDEPFTVSGDGSFNASDVDLGVEVRISLAETAESSDTLELLLDGISFNTPLTTTLNAGDSSHTFTIGSGQFSEGTNDITAIHTDAAGNASAQSDVLTVTVDTIDPIISNISIDSPTNNTTPTLTFTADSDDGYVYVYDDNDDYLGNAVTDGFSQTITLLTLSEGDHILTLKATDAVQNTVNATALVTIDITAPSVPNTPEPSATSNYDGSINALEEADGVEINVGLPRYILSSDTFELLLDGNSFDDPITYNNFRNDDDSYSFPIASDQLSEGTNSITAILTDAAGNTSAESSALTLTVDTTAPSVPSNVSIDSTTTYNEPELTFTADLYDTISVTSSLDGTVGTADVTTAPQTITLSTLSDGYHTLNVTAYDAAGNTAITTVTIDVDYSTPSTQNTPTASIDPITNDNTPDLTVTADLGNTITVVSNVYTDTDPVATDILVTAVPQTITLALIDDNDNDSPLIDGTHNLDIIATDPSTGNTASTTTSVYIDTIAPSAPETPYTLIDSTITTSEEADGFYVYISLDSSSTNGSTLELLLDGNPFDTALATTFNFGINTHSFLIESGQLSLGTNSITAILTDAAGNTSAPSDALTLTVDTTAQNVLIVSITTPTSDTTPDLTVTADSGNTITVTSDQYDIDDILGTITANGTSQIITLTNGGSSLSEKTHNLTIVATDSDTEYSASTTITLTIIDSSSTTDDDDNGGSGDNKHKTKPTFGLDHNSGKQLVDDAFTFNGKSFQITDNFWTPFEEQKVYIGKSTTFSAKVYAEKGLRTQEFVFGIPNTGQADKAELDIEVHYNYDGEVEDVNVVQKTAIIDVDTLSVFHEKSKCQASDSNEYCDTTTISVTFLEPLKDKVMAIKAIDFKNRYIITYLNEGIVTSGDSLNPMLVNTIAGPEKYEGVILVTQTAKYSNIWMSDDGREFQSNDAGTFTQINKTYERTADTGDIKNREHSAFADYKSAQADRASILLMETCPNCFEAFTDFDDSWTYKLPETFESKYDNPELQQQIILENHKAQELMGYILDPAIQYKKN